MHVMLLGASGFIGTEVLHALLAAGHHVTACARNVAGKPVLPGVDWLALDLARPLDEQTLHWPERIDVLVNAAGVLDTAATMQAVHEQGLLAVATRCRAQGARVIQLSALGADVAADTVFLRSKGQADAILLAADARTLVIRPSLVLGAAGQSSQWLLKVAAWPWAPLLGGQARLQPLAVEDLAAFVRRAVAEPALSGVYELGGPVQTLPELLQGLRARAGWRSAWYSRVSLPDWCLALCGERLATLARLAQRDNCLAVGVQQAQLPASLQAPRWPALAGQLAVSQARQWLLLALLCVWLGTAWACLGPGRAWGEQLLLDAGFSVRLVPWLVIAGAVLDASLGVGLLIARWRRRVLQAQILLVLGYTLMISWLLPHYWYDPLAAVLKNLPILAASGWLLSVEPKR